MCPQHRHPAHDVLVVRRQRGGALRQPPGLNQIAALDGSGAGSHRLVRLGHVQQTFQTVERLRVIVDADVDRHALPGLVPYISLDHEQRRRLAAAEVAAGGLGSAHGREQAPLQCAVRGHEGVSHRLRHAGGGHHVGLAAEPVALDVPGERDRVGARERRGGAVGGQHRHLPLIAPLVGGCQRTERGRRRLACSQPVEQSRAVSRQAEGLGRDHADARASPWADRADSHHAGLDGNAHPPVAVAGEDRVRHAASIASVQVHFWPFERRRHHHRPAGHGGSGRGSQHGSASPWTGRNCDPPGALFRSRLRRRGADRASCSRSCTC